MDNWFIQVTNLIIFFSKKNCETCAFRGGLFNAFSNKFLFHLEVVYI